MADPIRLALLHTELARDGPGLLYRDILKGAEDVYRTAQRIAQAQADVVVLLDVDYDLQLLALNALANEIGAQGGPLYPVRFALRPNSGIPTGFDLDRDARTGEPEDAQGFGAFNGEGGMAVLSKWPVEVDSVRDFSDRLWAGFDWASLPKTRDGLFPSPEVYEVQRLSTTGHWMVPIRLPSGKILRLGLYHATPPVFDGPEDRNGLRNADETLFWAHQLADNPDDPLVILGGANLDPERGDGRRSAIRALLKHSVIQDPFPRGTLTVDWSDLGLGSMRTDYILPTRHFDVIASGTIWPDVATEHNSRHALIWVDLALP